MIPTGSHPGNPSSAVHTYTAGGQTYDITPTAYGGGKSYPAGTVPVLVNDVPADVTAPASLSNAVGQATDLSATFTDPGVGETHTALVQWGDGTTSTATVTTAGGVDTVTASYTYPLHGSYAATLTVVDSGGATAIVPFTVAVAYVPPAVSIAASATVAGGATTLTLHDGGPEAASAVTGWAVDWGVTDTDGTEDVQSVTTPPDADGDWVVPHVYGSTGTYNVHATAIDAEGSHDAGWTTVTVAAAVAPPAPAGLTATATGPGEVDLAWSDPSGLATDFDVLRSDDGGQSFEQIVDVVATGGGPATYADPTTVAGAAYEYEVIANNAAGSSDATDPVEADTPVLPPTVDAVHATDDGTVDLSWSDAVGAATDPRYEVDRLTTAGTWAVLPTVDSAATGDVYTDAGLAPGTTYTYQIRTIGDTAGQDSAYAGPFTATTPQSGPVVLSATTVSQNEIDLSWTASTDPNATATNVYVSTDGINFSYYDAVPSSATSYQAVGLTAGMQYTFKVAEADVDQDLSTPSNAAAATTDVDPWDVQAIGNPTAAEGGEYQLALSIAPSVSAPAFDHWTVDWGDGLAPDTYAAGTVTATHVFAPGIDTTIIDATAATADGTSLVVAAPPVVVDLVPLPPSGLTATAASATEVDLGWADASRDADGYAVLRSTDGGATFQQVADVGPGATAYADTSVDATAGPVYEVEATGVTATIESAPAVLPAPVPPPAASAGTGMPTLAVAAGPAGTDSAVVSWAYAGTDDTGFELESFDEDGPDNYALIATPGPVGAAGTGSMTVPGLVPGHVYDFRLRADHVGGTASHYTPPAILSAGTGAVPSLALSFTSLPGYGDQVVRVGWAGAAAGGSVQLQVTGDLYAGDGWHTVPDLKNQKYPAAYVGSEGDVAGLQGYVDDAGMYGFEQTALYLYRIRGFDAADNPTAWSQPQSITPSIPLTSGGTIGVGLTASSTTSIVVSLPEPADGHYGEGRIAVQARGRDQYWANDNGNAGQQGTISGDGAMLRSAVGGLTPGTTYDVCVYYQEYEGGGVYGDVCHGKATITTPGNPGDPVIVPAAPAGLHGVYLGDGISLPQAELIWNNTSNNEDGFFIERSYDPDFRTYIDKYRVGADVTNYITGAFSSPDDYEMYYRVAAYRGDQISSWIETGVTASHSPIATAISWFPSLPASADPVVLSLIPLANRVPPARFDQGSNSDLDQDLGSLDDFVATDDYRAIAALQVGFGVDPYTGRFTAYPHTYFQGGYTPVLASNLLYDVAGDAATSGPVISYNADHTAATVSLFAKFRLSSAEQPAAAFLNGLGTSLGYNHGGFHMAAWVWTDISYYIDNTGKTSVIFRGSAVPSQTDYLDGIQDGGYDMTSNINGFYRFLRYPFGSLGPPDNR